MHSYINHIPRCTNNSSGKSRNCCQSHPVDKSNGFAVGTQLFFTNLGKNKIQLGSAYLYHTIDSKVYFTHVVYYRISFSCYIFFKKKIPLIYSQKNFFCQFYKNNRMIFQKQSRAHTNKFIIAQCIYCQTHCGERKWWSTYVP